MKSVRFFLVLWILLPCPLFMYAQAGLSGDLQGFQGVLQNIYSEMLPLCGSLISVGRGIAGFAATWYIAVRVWRHIAQAEPVDIFPLLRPFVLGFALLIFPQVIALINGVLQPTVSATSSLVGQSDQAIALLLQQKEKAIQQSSYWQMFVGPDGQGDQDKWYQYTHPDGQGAGPSGLLGQLSSDIQFQMAKMEYSLKNTIKEWMSEVLQVLFEAAALCINTVRIFYLIVLAILGPLVFGLSVFDGFHHTLTVWLARYINVFLWLPVANVFGVILGKIQQGMIQLDITQIQASGDTYFSSTDAGYLIFLVIGIIGYFTVPSVANYIVHAGGGDVLHRKVTQVFGNTTRSVVSAAGAGLGVTTDAMASGASLVTQSFASQGSSVSDLENSSHLAERLRGRSSSNT